MFWILKVKRSTNTIIMRKIDMHVWNKIYQRIEEKTRLKITPFIIRPLRSSKI